MCLPEEMIYIHYWLTSQLLHLWLAFLVAGCRRLLLARRGLPKRPGASPIPGRAAKRNLDQEERDRCCDSVHSLAAISNSKVADKTNNPHRRAERGDRVDIRDLERRAKMITM